MEVGCGTGERSTRPLWFCYPGASQIIAIDSRAKMITEAEDIHQYSNVKFVVADIADWTSLKKWEGQVSHMVSLRYLNIVYNHKIAFDNIFRLLKPGGEAALLFPVASDAYEFILKVTKSQIWKPYFTDTFIAPESYENDWNEEHYEELLTDVGFNVKHISLESGTFFYATEEMFKEDIRTSLAQTIPTELKEKFAEDILEMYYIYYGGKGNNGPFNLDYYYISCFLKKPEFVIAAFL
ncbi:methyltransf_25 domain-containing protein [Nephila pilipes]|uniref:Methyltransf_25 domain-containing protein n=1 Tax=Nephila pilipes TaxID=299642 RepID=A0A8X6R171_NEPPI|nr:methyltransf_25 domain-containing protein [Nephila pilipes]